MISPELKIGILVSSLIHAAVFQGGPLGTPPRYEVTVSPSSLEVSLMAAKPQKAEPEVKKEVPVEDLKKEPVEQEKTAKQTQEERFENKIRGAFTQAKPLRHENEPPHYPRLARQRGYEGTVLLRVRIAKSGRVLEIEILKTSGHRLLDESAVKAIGDWRFEPGRRFGLPVEGVVDIPVTFQLTE